MRRKKPGAPARWERGSGRRITPSAKQGQPRLRFSWNTPLFPSSHTEGVLYCATQYAMRSPDRGESWQRIENGLSSWFGFPVAIDRRSRTLFVHPMESDEYRMPTDGKFRMFRSRDGGDSWEPLSKGLPQQRAYMGVLRGALDVDHLDPCGVYVGTTAGTVYASRDAGDSWTELPCTLPKILCVEAFRV